MMDYICPTTPIIPPPPIKRGKTSLIYSTATHYGMAFWSHSYSLFSYASKLDEEKGAEDASNYSISRKEREGVILKGS